MKHYLTKILKSDTSSGDINEKVYHWLYSFGKFHKKYIIMPLESLNSSFLEESFRKKTIAADVLFILENIRIYFQMDAGEFEGLLYTILSEESFNNQIFNMTEETDDYTIGDYVSQQFGMLIEETMTCLICHEKNAQSIEI